MRPKKPAYWLHSDDESMKKSQLAGFFRPHLNAPLQKELIIFYLMLRTTRAD
jgi:hypothetical protein